LNNVSAKRGFTIVEVLMAVFVLAVGITGLVGAISGLTRAESRIAERDLIDRIAHEKLDELVATQTWQSEAGGGFDDPRFSDYTWSIEEENVGIENLTGLTLTVDSTNKGSVSISTVVFTAPAATGNGSGAAGGAATPGGGNN
jgi:prepilin-type N-terminal cleavage/methylation domain-containing protein